MSKKSLALILTAVLAIGSIAYGSVAYLTSTSGLTNTFSVGSVKAKLDETLVNAQGEPVDEQGSPVTVPEDEIRKEQGNAYHLIPGRTYRKDPMMTILQGSEESYVRMLVTVTNAKELKEIFTAYAAEYPAGFLPQNHQQGWDSAIWPCAFMTEDTTANTITLEFRYHKTVAAPDADQALEPLFTSIIVPSVFTVDDLAKLTNFKIEVVGQTMQAAGFDTADLAWAAFEP